MDQDKKAPIIIKKYANRRLYHTGSSSYITLEDLAQMVRNGDDFVVMDAKSGEDITRSVLAQIILEKENKGQSLLPSAFLRQLIQFYGDSMQGLVPEYLEFSLKSFIDEQNKLREQLTKNITSTPEMFSNPLFAQNPFAKKAVEAMEEQVKKNIAIFTGTIQAFNPFLHQKDNKEDNGGENK